MATYYVATNGNNGSAGDIDHPWATWRYGIESLDAGDTLYIRGGVYNPPNSERVDGSAYVDISNVQGTVNTPTCVYAYPDDYLAGNIPILDCSLFDPSTTGWNTVISIYRCRFWRFKGLTIRDVAQDEGSGEKACAWNAYECDNLYYEACTASNVMGRGFYILNADWITPYAADNTSFINCDAYDCCDSFSYYMDGDTRVDNAGNGADGFFIQMLASNEGHCIMDGCRVWHNSDDGINLDGDALFEIKNTWAFNGGWAGVSVSEGNGIKIDSRATATTNKILTNCIVANNSGFGYDPNNALSGQWPRQHIYNCNSYNNYYGFLIQNCDESPEPAATANIYRNCISYNDDLVFLNVPRLQNNTTYNYTIDHCTWRYRATDPFYQSNPDYTVTAADFISLDVEELKRSRKSDGSLPDVDFMKLAVTSDLIGGGVDVGLTTDCAGNPYSNPPSLGAFEYTSTDPIDSVVSIHTWSII
jgi:hypothetical protein